MSRFATPLRYPGGKQRLTPFILELLKSNDLENGEYVEPYAGGAGVAIELLVSKAVSRVHLNDSSFPVYAFWASLIQNPDEMSRRISAASLTVDEWKKHREILRNPNDHDQIDVGFSTFYLNRCNRSGVLSGGLIGGLKQDGEWLMDARFNKNDLIRRFEVIALQADKIMVTNQDAETFLTESKETLPENTLIYCDPPYYEKSSGLYLDKYKHSDHARVAKVIQEELKHKWVVSYDSAYEILNLYTERRTFLYDLQYSASTSYKGREVFIFSDGMTLPESSTLPYIDQALNTVNGS